MRRNWIDLNSDMGESFGNFVLGRPEEVMQRISHANIALRLSCRRSELDESHSGMGQKIWGDRWCPPWIS